MRLLLIVGLVACGSADLLRDSDQRRQDSAPAVAALQASEFDAAGRAAKAALAQDPRNARAAAVQAIVTYRLAGLDLIQQLELVLQQGLSLKALDHEKGRRVWLTFLERLERVERDLAIVAADPAFSLELCLACWEHDWNGNGRVDANDRKMLEIEFDGKGGLLAEGDPRRRPTYHFDVGDAEWARAMIAFQRAAVEIILAYKWSELDGVFGRDLKRMVIRIDDKSRVRRARTLVLAGLEHSDRCRRAYLAETDDDREWVPNPTQKSYAMPLEVDGRLYDTWKGVLGDVRDMLDSKNGISLREAKQVMDPSDAALVPDVYLDIGAMLREPKDIVIDFRSLDRHDGDKRENIDAILKDLLGNGYKKSMKPSPIVARLRKMKDELTRGEDTFERKLRYLFWLN